MPRARIGEIQIEYETFGETGSPALLLIAGLGQQLLSWDERLCRDLASHGLFVIRFDNRDVGLSTHLDHLGKVRFRTLIPAVTAGEDPEVAYSLADMAEDAAGLLDHLGIAAAHVVGVSMGGMIAQLLAMAHPHRVRSMTSIMSTTGDTSVGRGTPEANFHLYAPPPSAREGAIRSAIAAARVIATEVYFDEAEAATLAGAAYDRAFNPGGIGRQLAAILTTEDRTPDLQALQTPTLVIHGSDDALIAATGGRATADAIPGAEIIMIDGMGHDLPQPLWPDIVAPIVDHVERVERGVRPREP
jgi:pimeloyl-ACP methyl ester carboxylesterase